MTTDLTDSILYLDAVSVSSFVVGRGELRAIIGPNGAGKTTMMDVVTGTTRPDQGAVVFDGSVDLTTQDESAIASLGIGRKFQKPTVFDYQTVEDNLLLAVEGPRTAFSSLFGWRSKVTAYQIYEALSIIRLGDLKYRLAGSLSHGQKQWLEIGMLLAQNPKLLLVDEPVAGMTDAETEETARLLTSIAGEHAVVVVEHDMSFVRALDCKVTCLHEGTVLAEGTIDSVSANDRVIDVYLGR